MTPMPKDPIKAEEFREKQRANTIKYFENPENRKKRVWQVRKDLKIQMNVRK
jgi:hypothetical protein